MLYKHLHGQMGLTSQEPGWEGLEIDQAGFRGLTCHANVRGSCERACFEQGGYKHKMVYTQGTVEYISMPSDVIAFESAPPDEAGFHAAIMFEDKS